MRHTQGGMLFPLPLLFYSTCVVSFCCFFGFPVELSLGVSLGLGSSRLFWLQGFRLANSAWNGKTSSWKVQLQCDLFESFRCIFQSERTQDFKERFSVFSLSWVKPNKQNHTWHGFPQKVSCSFPCFRCSCKFALLGRKQRPKIWTFALTYMCSQVLELCLACQQRNWNCFLLLLLFLFPDWQIRQFTKCIWEWTHADCKFPFWLNLFSFPRHMRFLFFYIFYIFLLQQVEARESGIIKNWEKHSLSNSHKTWFLQQQPCCCIFCEGQNSYQSRAHHLLIVIMHGQFMPLVCLRSVSFVWERQ